MAILRPKNAKLATKQSLFQKIWLTSRIGPIWGPILDSECFQPDKTFFMLVKDNFGSEIENGHACFMLSGIHDHLFWEPPLLLLCALCLWWVSCYLFLASFHDWLMFMLMLTTHFFLYRQLHFQSQPGSCLAILANGIETRGTLPAKVCLNDFSQSELSFGNKISTRNQIS